MLEIADVARYDRRVLHKRCGGNTEVIGADFDLLFLQFQVALDGRFIEIHNLDAGQKASVGRQTPMSLDQTVRLFSLAYLGVPSRELFFHGDDSNCQIFRRSRFNASNHARMFFLE